MKKKLLFIIYFFSISVVFAKLDLGKIASSVATTTNTTNTANTAKSSSNKNSNPISSLTNSSIDKSLNNALKSVQDEIISKLDKEIKKIEDVIDKNITNIVSKFEGEVNKASEKVNGIIKKAENLTNDIEKQYKSIIAMKDKAIASGMAVIAKLPTIIMYIKIFAISILCLFIAMVFFFWRAYKNIKNLSKDLIDLDLKTKLRDIESKIDDLLRK